MLHFYNQGLVLAKLCQFAVKGSPHTLVGWIRNQTKWQWELRQHMDEGSKLHIMRIYTCYCYCKRHGKIAKDISMNQKEYRSTSAQRQDLLFCIENANHLSEIDASCMGSSTARQSTFWCQSRSKSVAFVTSVRDINIAWWLWTTLLDPKRKASKESTIERLQNAN